MRDRFGARRPESMRLRFHCQTAGSSLTAREPLNNIARTALQAMSAVLGGAQSLHANGMDEALAIPSELAMKVALRTQQIILDETRVANTVDPMAGGYFLEALTDEVEAGIWSYVRRIDDLGGAVAAAEQNFFQTEIADTAYRYHRQKERGELPVVGVNKYVDRSGDDPALALHEVDAGVEARQREGLGRVKRARDGHEVDRCLAALAEAARGDANIIPPTIDAVRAQATLGEIVGALRAVFGAYVERPVF
jgi:methylmalonyl-CoA mutase N-terminal domain/subunit